MPRFRAPSWFALSLLACSAGGLACSSSDSGSPAASGGNASGSAGLGGSGQAGTAGSFAAGGTLGGSVSTGGSAGSATAGSAGAATAGTGGGGSSTGGAGGGGGGGTGGGGGSAGAGGGGGAANKVPMCLTNAVADGVDRAANNYIECDVEDQAIDFDVMAAYPQGRKPGYDPTTTPVSFTDYGSALTGYEVQECHPYCYQGNLTLGLDLIAGSDASLRGEVLFSFPPTVAPIAMASGRASLGWVWIDGPPLPAGTKLTLQMVLKSNDKGLLLANDTKDAVPQKWYEFRYFPIDQGFNAADLTNITHIGFRVTLSPTAAAADWHGVIYADHFQLRK